MDITEQLLRDEGLRLNPYRDSVGKLTIGVGRNLDDEGITKEEALYLLQNDIASHKADLDAQLPWAAKLDDARYGALLNMCFNMGIRGLLGFHHALADLEYGNYDTAADEFEQSLWAKQVGIRATRLIQQIREGTWV